MVQLSLGARIPRQVDVVPVENGVVGGSAENHTASVWLFVAGPAGTFFVAAAHAVAQTISWVA
jgi:hypothetical protein